MCPVTAPSQLRLPWTDRAPGLARAFLTQTACPVHGGRVVDEAELLVSELVTNAIQHGTPPVTLLVHCQGESGLCISVSDENPQDPVKRDVDADGVHHHHHNDAGGARGGKEVWCTLLP